MRLKEEICDLQRQLDNSSTDTDIVKQHDALMQKITVSRYNFFAVHFLFSVVWCTVCIVLCILCMLTKNMKLIIIYVNSLYQKYEYKIHSADIICIN